MARLFDERKHRRNKNGKFAFKGFLAKLADEARKNDGSKHEGIELPDGIGIEKRFARDKSGVTKPVYVVRSGSGAKDEGVYATPELAAAAVAKMSKLVDPDEKVDGNASLKKIGTEADREAFAADTLGDAPKPKQKRNRKPKGEAAAAKAAPDAIRPPSKPELAKMKQAGRITPREYTKLLGERNAWEAANKTAAKREAGAGARRGAAKPVPAAARRRAAAGGAGAKPPVAKKAAAAAGSAPKGDRVARAGITPPKAIKGRAKLQAAWDELSNDDRRKVVEAVNNGKAVRDALESVTGRDPYDTKKSAVAAPKSLPKSATTGRVEVPKGGESSVAKNVADFQSGKLKPLDFIKAIGLHKSSGDPDSPALDKLTWEQADKLMFALQQAKDADFGSKAERTRASRNMTRVMGNAGARQVEANKRADGRLPAAKSDAGKEFAASVASKSAAGAGKGKKPVFGATEDAEWNAVKALDGKSAESVLKGVLSGSIDPLVGARKTGISDRWDARPGWGISKSARDKAVLALSDADFAKLKDKISTAVKALDYNGRANNHSIGNLGAIRDKPRREAEWGGGTPKPSGLARAKALGLDKNGVNLDSDKLDKLSLDEAKELLTSLKRARPQDDWSPAPRERAIAAAQYLVDKKSGKKPVNPAEAERVAKADAQRLGGLANQRPGGKRRAQAERAAGVGRETRIDGQKVNLPGLPPELKVGRHSPAALKRFNALNAAQQIAVRERVANGEGLIAAVERYEKRNGDKSGVAKVDGMEQGFKLGDKVVAGGKSGIVDFIDEDKDIFRFKGDDRDRPIRDITKIDTPEGREARAEYEAEQRGAQLSIGLPGKKKSVRVSPGDVIRSLDARGNVREGTVASVSVKNGEQVIKTRDGKSHTESSITEHSKSKLPSRPATPAQRAGESDAAYRNRVGQPRGASALTGSDTMGPGDLMGMEPGQKVDKVGPAGFGIVRRPKPNDNQFMIIAHHKGKPNDQFLIANASLSKAVDYLNRGMDAAPKMDSLKVSEVKNARVIRPVKPADQVPASVMPGAPKPEFSTMTLAALKSVLADAAKVNNTDLVKSAEKELDKRSDTGARTGKGKASGLRVGDEIIIKGKEVKIVGFNAVGKPMVPDVNGRALRVLRDEDWRLAQAGTLNKSALRRRVAAQAEKRRLANLKRFKKGKIIRHEGKRWRILDVDVPSSTRADDPIRGVRMQDIDDPKSAPKFMSYNRLTASGPLGGSAARTLTGSAAARRTGTRRASSLDGNTPAPVRKNQGSQAKKEARRMRKKARDAEKLQNATAAAAFRKNAASAVRRGRLGTNEPDPRQRGNYKSSDLKNFESANLVELLKDAADSKDAAAIQRELKNRKLTKSDGSIKKPSTWPASEKPTSASALRKLTSNVDQVERVRKPIQEIEAVRKGAPMSMGLRSLIQEKNKELFGSWPTVTGKFDPLDRRVEVVDLEGMLSVANMFGDGGPGRKKQIENELKRRGVMKLNGDWVPEEEWPSGADSVGTATMRDLPGQSKIPRSGDRLQDRFGTRSARTAVKLPDTLDGNARTARGKLPAGDRVTSKALINKALDDLPVASGKPGSARSLPNGLRGQTIELPDGKRLYNLSYNGQPLRNGDGLSQSQAVKRIRDAASREPEIMGANSGRGSVRLTGPKPGPNSLNFKSNGDLEYPKKIEDAIKIARALGDDDKAKRLKELEISERERKGKALSPTDIRKIVGRIFGAEKGMTWGVVNQKAKDQRNAKAKNPKPTKNGVVGGLDSLAVVLSEEGKRDAVKAAAAGKSAVESVRVAQAKSYHPNGLPKYKGDAAEVAAGDFIAHDFDGNAGPQGAQLRQQRLKVVEVLPNGRLRVKAGNAGETTVPANSPRLVGKPRDTGKGIHGAYVIPAGQAPADNPARYQDLWGRVLKSGDDVGIYDGNGIDSQVIDKVDEAGMVQFKTKGNVKRSPVPVDQIIANRPYTHVDQKEAIVNAVSAQVLSSGVGSPESVRKAATKATNSGLAKNPGAAKWSSAYGAAPDKQALDLALAKISYPEALAARPAEEVDAELKKIAKKLRGRARVVEREQAARPTESATLQARGDDLRRQVAAVNAFKDHIAGKKGRAPAARPARGARRTPTVDPRYKASPSMVSKLGQPAAIKDLDQFQKVLDRAKVEFNARVAKDPKNKAAINAKWAKDFEPYLNKAVDLHAASPNQPAPLPANMAHHHKPAVLGALGPKARGLLNGSITDVEEFDEKESANSVYTGKLNGEKVFIKPLSKLRDMNQRAFAVPLKQDDRHEVAAGIVMEALKINGPGVVIRDVPGLGPAIIASGVGDKNMLEEVWNGYDLGKYRNNNDVRQIAFLDQIIGNIDRHPDNMRMDRAGARNPESRKLYPIDHGLAFADRRALAGGHHGDGGPNNTPLIDYLVGGQPLTAAQVQQLKDLRANKQLWDAMEVLLNKEQVKRMRARVEYLYKHKKNLNRMQILGEERLLRDSVN